MNKETKKILKKIFPMGLLVAGHNFVSFIKNKLSYIWFNKDWKEFRKQTKEIGDKRFELSNKDLYPILTANFLRIVF